MVWEVYHGDARRLFRSFDAAERWARARAAEVDGRGFSKRAKIYDDVCEVAVVRMSGDGRVWTDVVSEELRV